MDIEREILALQERNKKVEADKAWEGSWTRRLAIAIPTYLLAGWWLVSIEDRDPWLKAFVPAVGYLLSTFTISFLKKHWLSRHNG